MTPLEVDIRAEGAETLADYGRVAIAYEVREALDVDARALEGIVMHRRGLDVPYVKDYDATPSNRPADWGARFDLRRWGILAARSRGARVGGAVVAFGSPGVEMLRGRDDRAVLWDLRVDPARRGRGLGRALFAAAERWATARGARWLSVETQNVNVPACRLYESMGCTLGEIDRFAYPDLPGEVRLVWWKRLGDA
jgi:ribosomal protein S18 acetylase RimI-like enzyme